MGYYNPIHRYGTARFAKDAAAAGVDGLITVDLPPEEDEVLRAPAAAQGLDVIRLATPTTDARRLPVILDGASGFLYYVSIAGVTGTKTFAAAVVREAVAKVKARAQIPMCGRFWNQDAGTGRRNRPLRRWGGGGFRDRHTDGRSRTFRACEGRTG